MASIPLSFVEDSLQWLQAVSQPDSRDELRAARLRELAERGKQPAAGMTAGSHDIAGDYVHECGQGPGVAAAVGRQHWAAPYDDDYLVVEFPPTNAFKILDVVALSAKEDLSFDDLKAAIAKDDSEVVLEMTYPVALKGKPWLTSIPVSRLRSGGALYLHCFFAAKPGPGEEGCARKVICRKLFDRYLELPQLENPQTVAGVAASPHPALAPHLISGDTGAPPLVYAGILAGAPTGAVGQVFERVFLTLGGPNLDGERTPWKAYVVLNVELAPDAVIEKNDYIALAGHYPQHALDYLTRQWQYVANLDEGPSYETWTRCDFAISSNLTVADLEKLESLYIFYGREDDNGWIIVGEPATFRKQKHWMADSFAAIGQKHLHEIVIPGTHDSGTYDPEAKGTDIAINSQAQNLDFRGQLALGIRYFDCRLENWPKAHPLQPFYFAHGGAWMWTEITDLVAALREFFVIDGSRDIVILDFSHFDNFGPSDYTKLFDLFKNDTDLGPAIVTSREARGLTISELVDRGKRLLILSSQTAAGHGYLGRSVNNHNQWANTNDRATLKTFLDGQVRQHGGKNSLWALQAVLTPFYPWPISPRADEVSRVLRTWLVNDWWADANVVFCDFAGGADLVHAAGVCNRKRYNPSKGNLSWCEHPDWLTGGPRPPTGPMPIAFGGWMGFKSVFASSEGWIYGVDWDGSLQRYHDAHWQNGGPMSTARTAISSGQWLQYRKVFASSDGWIYAIDSIGKLWRWHDTGGDTLGSGVRIDAGWEHYPIVFASSDRWIYAIDSVGQLWRWHDTGGAALGDGVQIDTGWESYKTAFATSDGVIYGIDWHGALWWWRDHWGNDLGDGKQVDTGWGSYRMAFATSQGRLYGIDG